MSQRLERAQSTVISAVSAADWQAEPQLAQYHDWLKERLGKNERFEHSLGVCEASIELARGFKHPPAFIYKAAIAGLLHDSAKLMTPAQLLAYADDWHIHLDEWDKASPQTLHPYIGAALVKKELGIADSDILMAISSHTTGRTGMSTLEKIVYIADKTEKRTRKPDYIAEMTKNLDFDRPESLDETLLSILDGTLRFLLDRRQTIHPRTIDTRNEILSRLK